MAGTSRWQAVVLSAFLGLTAVCVAAAVPATAGVAPLALTTGRTLSGVVGSGGQPAIDAFSAWRGHPVEVVTAYTGTSTWDSITGITKQGLTKYWDNSNAHMVWSVPLLPLHESASLQIAATGAYNSKYASVAQQLVAGGDGAATIRLAWEMTGDWYTWSGVKDPVAFAGAWRQAVTAMRSVSGAHFTFDFNIAMGSANPVPMYPGDAYVDLIGADHYDNSWSWSYPSSDHVRAWNGFLTESYGLNWLAGFAAQHGKRLSFPEWGVQWTCDGHGGGDDPYFIQQFHNWIASHDVAYESYFNTDYDACTKSALLDGHFPQAAALYQRLSAAPVVATPPPTTPPPAPAGALDLTRIRLSTSATRSGSVMLFGATVTGAAYIWLVDAAGTTQVRFYLDRATTSTPTQTDRTLPWDLKGGTTDAANPLPAGTLSVGSHQLTVLATTSSGVVQSATVSFTVK
ncbi:MAG: hypothetical protein QOJ11_2952 [Frankiales bacterium]|jgi:hypothetical protein|nr:hypothetical protein [Frankiales bacterium]